MNEHEAIGVEGNWTVFKVTEPNIEVRTGAILSLERIAKDSTRYDNGHDHVLIMEILCAYVKENAPIKDPTARPSNIVSREDVTSAKHWAEDSPKLRADIKIALGVIGRRSPEQVQIEKANHAGGGHYKLDLSNVDIRRADLTGLNFSDAFLRGSWLDGSFLNGTNFRGANLLDCGFVDVSAVRAQFQGASFGADFSGAILNQAEFEFHETGDDDAAFTGYNGRRSNFSGASLLDAKLVFSGNSTVVRGWAIGAIFTDATMRGCLFDGYSDFYNQEWPQSFHSAEKGEKGLAFRNCYLSNEIESRCSLDFCFGDGSVLLADGSGSSWPEHWPQNKLSDADFKRKLQEWRLTT